MKAHLYLLILFMLPKAIFACQDEDYWDFQLIQSLSDNNFEEFQERLKSTEIQIDAVNNEGNTILMLCISQFFYDEKLQQRFINAVIAKNPNLEHKNIKNETPFILACTHVKKALIEYLIQRQAHLTSDPKLIRKAYEIALKDNAGFVEKVHAIKPFVTQAILDINQHVIGQ